METNDASNNVEVSTEQPVATESAPAPVEETKTTAPAQKQEPEESFFDPNQVPPELQAAYKSMQAAFTKKTQGLAEYKKKAESLDQLVGYDPFVQWYNKHLTGADKEKVEQPKAKPAESTAPKNPGLFEDLSDEEYQLLMTDKGKMGKYLQAKIQEQAMNVAMPGIQQAQQKVQYMENLSKIERFAQEHPDFWELDKKGLIEPLIDRYPGLELDDIYKLAKFPFVQQEAVQKAHQMVQMKQSATVEKPGLGLPSVSKAKVKSREEAMSLAWDYAARGQAVPDMEIG